MASESVTTVRTVVLAAIPAGAGSGPFVPPSSGAPVNITRPSISGNPAEGETLTADPGTWTRSPTSYTYQWYADGVAIGGETVGVLDLTDAELGTAITVGVVAHNAVGASADAFSDPTTLIVSAEVWAIAVAVWTYPDRVLASGTPDPPTDYLEEVEEAVWTAPTRTLS